MSRERVIGQTALKRQRIGSEVWAGAGREAPQRRDTADLERGINAQGSSLTRGGAVAVGDDGHVGAGLVGGHIAKREAGIGSAGKVSSVEAPLIRERRRAAGGCLKKDTVAWIGGLALRLQDDRGRGGGSESGRAGL